MVYVAKITLYRSPTLPNEWVLIATVLLIWGLTTVRASRAGRCIPPDCLCSNVMSRCCWRGGGGLNTQKPLPSSSVVAETEGRRPWVDGTPQLAVWRGARAPRYPLPRLRQRQSVVMDPRCSHYVTPSLSLVTGQLELIARTYHTAGVPLADQWCVFVRLKIYSMFKNNLCHWGPQWWVQNL